MTDVQKLEIQSNIDLGTMVISFGAAAVLAHMLWKGWKTKALNFNSKEGKLFLGLFIASFAVPLANRLPALQVSGGTSNFTGESPYANASGVGLSYAATPASQAKQTTCSDLLAQYTHWISVWNAIPVSNRKMCNGSAQNAFNEINTLVARLARSGCGSYSMVAYTTGTC